MFNLTKNKTKEVSGGDYADMQMGDWDRVPAPDIVPPTYTFEERLAAHKAFKELQEKYPGIHFSNWPR